MLSLNPSFWGVLPPKPLGLFSGPFSYNLTIDAPDAPSLPDLSGTNFDVTPEPLAAGDSFNVSFKIQNTGGSSAGSFDVDFYLSTNSTITTSDKYLGTYAISSLAGNSSTTRTKSLALPGVGNSFWSGATTYYIGMIVDADGDVTESNESNNSNRGSLLDYDGVFIDDLINDAPTNLSLSNYSIAENRPVSTVVGTFSTTDPDNGDTFTYSLVSGAGDTDNSFFSIQENKLKTRASFDYETKNSYSIRVRTTDQGNLSFEKSLVIQITNVDIEPVGEWDPLSSAYGVAVVGNYAYVVGDRLGIINISNPSNPIFIGSYDIDNGQDVQVVGNYAYVADDYSGLQIIDISNPSNPTLKGSYDTSSYAEGVQVVGNYAYVADGNSGLQIIDISNPSNPILKGNYNTSDFAEGVEVVGNYAYVADGFSGLQIIDISNPSNPTLKSTYETSSRAEDVEVVGNYAYVADGNSGLQIIDISNPSNP